jgi:Fe2+ or Zn2+ uptake regulation protein
LATVYPALTALAEQVFLHALAVERGISAYCVIRARDKDGLPDTLINRAIRRHAVTDAKRITTRQSTET